MRATEQELADRAGVLIRLKDAIASNSPIAFPLRGQTSDFSAKIDRYRYTFEGEDDLLHLQIERDDGSELAQEEGKSVAEFVLKGVPPALVWMKTGRYTQHFYVGHDDLAASIEVT